MSTISAPEFGGLTPKQLAFSKLYATRRELSPRRAAVLAGYSDTRRAAHVRAAELLRDPRVIAAVLHYGALELVRLRGEAIARLRPVGSDDVLISVRMARAAELDRVLAKLEVQGARLERIFGAPQCDDLSDLLG